MHVVMSWKKHRSFRGFYMYVSEKIHFRDFDDVT